MKNISDEQKRQMYKKAFGKDYNDKNRRQAPLPLDIAFQVAMYKLKKEMSEYVEGDYNCDKCNKKGSFLDGSICGLEDDVCLCVECINNKES